MNELLPLELLTRICLPFSLGVHAASGCREGHMDIRLCLRVSPDLSQQMKQKACVVPEVARFRSTYEKSGENPQCMPADDA